MPNTEVKLLSAEDTCELPCWENRKSPVFLCLFTNMEYIMFKSLKRQKSIIVKTIVLFLFVLLKNETIHVIIIMLTITPFRIVQLKEDFL